MKMSVIYWSGTGNTSAMANAIAEGAKEAGAEVKLLEVGSASAADVSDADLVALGCPAMGAETLEDGEFEPFYESVKASLAGKKTALFGSYGWGDGEWMRTWQDDASAAGAVVFRGEGLILNEAPDAAGIGTCKAYGKEFAQQ